jgi:hypothetical protein
MIYADDMRETREVNINLMDEFMDRLRATVGPFCPVCYRVWSLDWIFNHQKERFELQVYCEHKE